jgi:hypothetical protein
MHRIFHSDRQMWAMTPSHRTGIVRHDWGSSNAAFTVDSLAACPLALSARASTGFSLHATVPLTLSIRGKKLLYSRCLSEAAILAADDPGPLWAHYDVPYN